MKKLSISEEAGGEDLDNSAAAFMNEVQGILGEGTKKITFGGGLGLRTKERAFQTLGTLALTGRKSSNIR